MFVVRVRCVCAASCNDIQIFSDGLFAQESLGLKPKEGQ